MNNWNQNMGMNAILAEDVGAPELRNPEFNLRLVSWLLHWKKAR